MESQRSNDWSVGTLFYLVSTFIGDAKLNMDISLRKLLVFKFKPL